MSHQNFHLLFRNNFFIPLLILIFLSFSCKKDEVKPLYNSGTISGYVNIQEDNDGPVLVTASGPYGTKSLKVVRNPETSQYKFSFSGLGNGTYKISAKKDSFGTVDLYNIAVFGTDSVWASYINLYKLAKNPAIPASPTYESQDNYSLVFNIAPVNWKNRLLVFMSTKNDVSYNKYQAYSHVYIENDIKLKFEKARIFKPDTKVYFIIYGSDDLDGGYINSYYNLLIFSSINPEKHSQVFSAIIK